MGVITTLVNVAKTVWGFLTGIPGDIGRALAGLWNFARQVQQVADYVLSHPLTELLNAFAAWAAVVTGNHQALANALVRIDPWIWRHRVLPLRAEVLLWLAQLRARIAYLFAQAYLYINLKFEQAEAYTRRLVAAEHDDMLQHFTAAEKYAFDQALMRYQAIEREAADSYNARLHERLGLIGTVADLAATRNPVVRALVADVTGALVDLAAVDNPVARLALGFVIREIIDRLAVDKPVGVLLGDLLGPVLGNPRARGVADTVGDLEDRIIALEREWATFMADGGPEVLQAGKDWRDLTSLVTDAALVAFMAETIAAPAVAAGEAAAVINPIAAGATAAWRSLLGL